MSDGNIKLTGTIEPGVVADVMQFISSRSDQIGFLLIHSAATEGRIWFQNGAMISAECGSTKDHDAIKRILGLKSGRFAFVDDKNAPERTIFDDTTNVLLECFRQLDEANSNSKTSDKPPVDHAPAPTTTDIAPAHPNASMPTTQPDTAQTPISLSQPLPVSAFSPASSETQQQNATRGDDTEHGWKPDPLGTLLPGETKPLIPEAPPRLARMLQNSNIDQTRESSQAARPKQAPRITPQDRANAYARRKRTIRMIRSCLLAAMILLLAFAAAVLYTERPKTANERVFLQRPNTTTGSNVIFLTSMGSNPPAVVIPDEVIRPAWPEIRFTGLSKIPGQKGLAIINDQIIREGDVIEGVTILSVTRTGLVAQCSNETRFLPFFIASESNPRSPGKKPTMSLNRILRQAFNK